MTCLGIGEKDKGSGIPCRAHEHPCARPVLVLVSVVLTVYPQPWGSHLNIVSDTVFAVSLWRGIHFMLSLVSKVKAGLGRSQGQSLGLPVNPERCHVFGE